MDFQAFLSALVADWVSMMSGIASVVLLIASVVRKWDAVPRWAFWVAATTCFFFASVRVWTTEHRAVGTAKAETHALQNSLDALLKPEFHMSLSQAQITIDKNTSVFMNTTLTNTGAASSALDWTAHYTSPQLDSDVPLIDFETASLPDKGHHKFKISKTDLVIHRAVAPIPHNGFIDGRLVVSIPGNRIKEINSGQARITVSVHDVTGRVYSATWKTSQNAKTSEREGIS